MRSPSIVAEQRSDPVGFPLASVARMLTVIFPGSPTRRSFRLTLFITWVAVGVNVCALQRFSAVSHPVSSPVK